MAKRKFTNFVPRPKPRKRPRRHKKSLSKSEKRSHKKYNRQGRWQNKINDYPIVMKEKIITIKVNGAAQGQWSHLLLELNLMKKAWKPYGVDMNLKPSGLRNVLNHGTKVNDGSNYTKRRSVSTNTSHK